MKNKTLKKLLCFLLAFVVMVSTPLNLQANALAIESWVIWAIVTYLTSVGLVFTATGGAQAVYDAVEEKVNQYGDNVIDFYDIVRGNIKIVKPPNQPPNWNPELGNLFLNAIAVEALSEFIEWLTSDGGWLGGTNVNEGYSFGTFDAQYQPDGGTYGETFTFATTLVDEWETTSTEKYQRAKIVLEGTSLPALAGAIVKTVNSDKTDYSILYYNSANKQYELSNYLNGSFSSKTFTSPSQYISKFGLNTTPEHIVENAQYAFVQKDGYTWGGVIYDGYLYLVGRAAQVSVIETTLSANIEIPTEIPEIKPLPTLEGLLLESESLAADSLEALGNVVETYFNDAGTIPAPQPNIIADPEAAPVPTPVPSPEIEDVGDLGLPALGEAIFSKFPFSLPKDLKRISDILNAEPVTPKWEVDLYETLGDRIPFRGSTKLTIDLEEYEELGQISRWASVISFVVFLIIITKGVIRW